MSKIPIKSVTTAGSLKLGQFKLSAKRIDQPRIEDDPYRHVRGKQSLLIDEIEKKRCSYYESIMNFPFNMARVRVLSECKEIIPERSKGVLYWMSREQRVQDNWSLLYAQKLAIQNNLPLFVCFCLVPSFLGATIRHYQFMIEGLKEVKKELEELNIPFYLLIGQAKDQVPMFVRDYNIGGVVCDFSPLRVSLKWVDDLRKNLPQHVHFAQLDGHNVVPCWHTSNKKEEAAFTIRPKINSQIDTFLTEFPPLICHPVKAEKPEPVSNNNENELSFLENLDDAYPILKVDKSVRVVQWAKPGYSNGMKMLQDFIDNRNRLRLYDTQRNNPNLTAQSNLSPWLHFGQISAQRCALETAKYLLDYGDAVQWFYEELVIRRELADNFCYYEPNYDSILGAPKWGYDTLQKHALDKRAHLYSLNRLESAHTHDQLWNATQLQLRLDGKIHGYLRMYWAKKMLEWTESPEQAIEFAIHLNDKYSLDGRDPGGYLGIMESLTGVHDKQFQERQVTGKVRTMTYNGCKSKFDVEAYSQRFMSRRRELDA